MYKPAREKGGIRLYPGRYSIRGVLRIVKENNNYQVL
jgi:hypothetical protein